MLSFSSEVLITFSIKTYGNDTEMFTNIHDYGTWAFSSVMISRLSFADLAL